MLRSLRIENLVLIRRAELPFAPGLNVITGETGAGKTMLAQAIGLLLGAKGDAAYVGAGGAESYVDQVIADNAVVMFSLEWCEFCWAVRKLLARMDIAFESVDLDSVALQQRDLGTQIRAVLKARTGSPTIPQVWIAGTHVGGATDLFESGPVVRP